MIGSALSRLDTAEKLSIPQLQQAIQSGTIPAYMGVPLLEEKIAFEQRMRSAAAARMAQGQQPTIAEQVMDQAQNQQMMDEGGIDQLPIEAPEFAGGGIVAFEDGGQVERFQNQGLVDSSPAGRFMSREFAGPMARGADIQEREMLKSRIISELGPRSGLAGLFMSQSDEARQAAKDVMQRLDTMSVDEMRSVLEGQPVGTPTPAPAPQGIEAAQVQAPRTDLRAPVKMIGGRPVPIDVKTGEELGIAPDMTEKPPALEGPAVSKPRGMESIIGDATRMTDALGLGPKKGERAPTIEEASKQTTELLEKSGYDEGLLKRMGQDISKQREGLEADRSEAKAYRLIEAGLGIMSGTSANAFENIGKGATPALKGLSSDLKEIKKAEREYQLAEQNLLLKQNEAAMGKAKVTQSTIDKAQDRLDKKAETYERTRADLARTMLSAETQKEIARTTYGKMTDFDKRWNIYSQQAKARGETPTPEGFSRAFGSDRETLSFKDAMAIAQKDAGLTLAEAEQEARRLMRLENASRGGRAQGLQMPTSKEGLQAGQVYETARGLAKWDGQKFTLVD
jgi:hypothetical protein